MVSVVSDTRELDEFKKHNKGESYALTAFKHVILDLTSQDSLPYRDLYFATKGAFELMNNDQEVWTNLLRQLNNALEDRFDANDDQVVKSHTPYLMRSLVLFLTHNPESNAFLRTTLENFMEDEFKKLSLLGKSELLADMTEK
jgi:hypothetical protein